MIKENNVKNKNKSKGNRTIYCHMSFRRPRGKKYGLFAVAFYKDYNGRNLITYKVKKIDLWENQQFISAIQAYENTLSIIYEYQGMMLDAGIRQVMIVTDNSILAGWIENPYKNKKYTDYMERAVKLYRVGATKEIVIGVGLCVPREKEKSYKYCKEENVSNIYIPNDSEKRSVGKIKLKERDFVSALDIVDKDLPEMIGIEELEV